MTGVTKKPVVRGLLVDAGPPASVPATPASYPISGLTMDVVDVDHISFYEGNPRRVRNPKYDEIKESIRATGLDNPLPISHRPGDQDGHYIIYGGGNTRLAILKELWAETGDQRFHKVKCRYIPFESDLDAMITHLRENEVRGEMTFIDSALAIQAIRQGLEAKSGEKFSYRRLEDELRNHGLPNKSVALLSRLDAAVLLNPHIPKALQAGMGRPQIERLLKLEKAALATWRFHGNRYGTDQEFRDKVLLPALAGSDSDTWAYEAAEAAVRLRLLANLPQGTDADAVQDSLKQALAGKELKILEPELPPPPQPTPPPAYAPLDQYSMFGGTPATPAPTVHDNGGGTPDGVYIQPPVRNPGPGTMGTVGWDGADEDDAMEDWMPHAHRKEVVVEGSGRWLARLSQLRGRNHELAVKLSNMYVPKGGDSIIKLDIGYGFMVTDAYDTAYLDTLKQRVEARDGDALLAWRHSANLWWFLLEISGMISGDDDLGTTNCPHDLIGQFVLKDSLIYNSDKLDLYAPHIAVWYRLQTWWLKLSDSQLGMVLEMVSNTRAIADIVLQHASEANGSGVWEISTSEAA